MHPDHRTLTDEQWRLIDEKIFERSGIPALKFLCGMTGLRFDRACAAIYDRYRTLRDKYPERFTADDEEYWEKSPAFSNTTGIAAGLDHIWGPVDPPPPTPYAPPA